MSFHSSSSDDEHEDDVLSSVQETEPCQESLSTILSDTQSIDIETRHERQILQYSRSLCVPYTNDQNEQDGMKIVFVSKRRTSRFCFFFCSRNIVNKRSFNNNINRYIIRF